MLLSDLSLRVYYSLPVALQNLAISAYGWRLRKLRYGKEHDRCLAELRATQAENMEQIRSRQLRELNRVLQHARNSVPYYAEDAPLPHGPLTDIGQIESLPILSKDMLRSLGTRLVSRTATQSELIEVHTGGTTGKPLTIYCDRSALQRNYAFFSRFREWAGAGGRVKTATFAGRTLVSADRRTPPFWRYNRAMRQLLFSSYHISQETIPAYVQGLSRFDPDLLDSYPSSLRPIARYLLDRGIDGIRPRAVITSSETLDDATRELIERAFGCRVFDHYGAAEMAAFVTQCEAGTYHVNHEFGIVEILRDGVATRPGETGEIFATGFINPVMPLIRYATGDRAAWGAAPCPCGRHMPGIQRLEGRMDDVLITPAGRLIGRLDPIFKSIEGVFETRIVQDRIDHVRIEVVPAEGYTRAEGERLVSELQRRLGPDVDIDIVEVTRIPRAASGKLRTVVCDVAVEDARSVRGRTI